MANYIFSVTSGPTGEPGPVFSSYTYEYNTAGSNTVTINANAAIDQTEAGYDGLVLYNPAQGTNSFAVNVNGGILTYTQNALDINNYLATTADSVTVGTEGGISGVWRGIFAHAVTSVTNKGDISGQYGIDYQGFEDLTDSSAAHSNIKASSKLTVTNAAGATISGDNLENNPTGSEGNIGINNFSYATLTVNNSGTISGGHDYHVYATAADYASGTDETGFGGDAINSFSALALTNAANALIDGNVFSGWFGTSISNKGSINGTIIHSLDKLVASDVDGSPTYSDSLYANNMVDITRSGSSAGAIATSAAPKSTYDNFGSIVATANYGYFNGPNGAADNDTSNDVYYQVAFDLSYGNDVITNEAGATIQGNIRTGADNDTLTNMAGAVIYGRVSMGTGNDIVTNKGEIDGNNNPQTSGPTVNTSAGTTYDGVYLDDGNNTLYNYNRIEGGVHAGAGTDMINNYAGAIIFSGVDVGTGGSAITNSGYIRNGVISDAGDTGNNTLINAATGQILQGVTFNDNDTTGAQAGNNTITNSGYLSGGVQTGNGNDTLNNSGNIFGQINLGSGTNVINNTGAGTLHSLVALTAGDDTVNNKSATSTIASGLALGEGTNHVDNFGIIQGLADPNSNYGVISGGAGADSIVNEKTGQIYGALVLGDGNNTLTNSGFMSGNFIGGTGDDTVTNSGTMWNAFMGDGADTVINTATGHIMGNVILGEYTLDNNGDLVTPNLSSTSDGDTGGNNALADGFTNYVSNAGIIQYSVAGADTNDKVVNSGTIIGNTYLLGGNDTFDDTNGKAVGAVYLGSGDDTFIGGKIAEHVYDEAGRDSYSMGAGNDTVSVLSLDTLANFYDGGAGIDTLDFSALADTHGITMTIVSATTNLAAAANLTVHDGSGNPVTEAAVNFEHVIGTNYADTIMGSASSDIIDGGQGQDTLTGRGGADQIFAGALPNQTGDGVEDHIRFEFASDSGVSRATRDEVHQFEDGIDKIEFADTFDFNTVKGATSGHLGSASDFIGENVAFTGVAGQINTIQIGGQTIVQVDTNGDKVTDFSVALDGTHHLTASDFLFDS